MAGLLDFLQTPEGQFGVNLLSAAGPSMQPVGFGQRLASAMQATREQQAAEQDRALRSRYVAAQLGALQSQEDERRLRQVLQMQEMQRQQAKRDALPGIFRNPAANASPTVENAARMDATPAQIDVQAALAAGYSPEEITSISSLRNVGRNKAARTIETTDAAGRPGTIMVDDFGSPIGQFMPKFTAPLQINQGDRLSLIDQVTMQPRGTFQINMTPDAKASNAVAWANNGVARGNLDLSRERLALDRQRQSGANGEMVFNADAGGYIPKRILPGQTPAVVSLPGLAPAKGSPEAKRQSSEQVVSLLNEADKLLNTATGSWGGKALDFTAALAGKSTEGAKSAASLKAIEGALVLNMPRMEGPQSNLDQMLYRQAAAQVGDETLPADTRRAALKTVRDLQQRYTGGAPAAPAPSGPASSLSLPGFTITEIR